MQAPVPEQAPLHPANEEPGAAAAFKETIVPSENWLEQVVPQSMPAGVEVTVPLPFPCFCTVTVKSLTSVISRLTGAPAVRFTPGNVPPNIFRGGDAALKADTVIVRLEPTGAWMLTGISCPLAGLETATVVVAGVGMPGPVI